MTSGDVTDGCNHDSNGQAMCHGDAEQAQAALVGGLQKLVGTDRAGAEENQGKRADKFRSNSLELAVHGISLRNDLRGPRRIRLPPARPILLKRTGTVKSTFLQSKQRRAWPRECVISTCRICAGFPSRSPAGHPRRSSHRAPPWQTWWGGRTC